MRILAIDTSGPDASVALLADGRAVVVTSLGADGRHGKALLPAIDRMTPRDAEGRPDAVAVAHGPGSYTGIRIGVAAATGIARALGVPVQGVSSLEAAALAVAERLPAGTDLAVLWDARRGAIYRARFLLAGPDAIPRRREEDRLVPPAGLADLPAGAIAVGDGARRYADRLPGGVAISEADLGLPRAAAVGRILGERLATGGEPLPPAPVYLRGFAS